MTSYIDIPMILITLKVVIRLERPCLAKSLHECNMFLIELSYFSSFLNLGIRMKPQNEKSPMEIVYLDYLFPTN